MKPLGTIFQTTSIDDAAREAVKYSRSWGGGITVAVDRTGLCTAHPTDMPATDRFIAADPGALVGVYEVAVNGNTDQRAAAARLIAEDICCHNADRHGERRSEFMIDELRAAA